MPKLIATDIDGTLLQNGETAVSDRFFLLASKLMDQGVCLCAASGRQYSSLRNLFAPIADRMYFLCENGAAVFGPGQQMISKTTVSRGTALQLCHDILAIDDAEVLISGADMSYLCPKQDSYVDHIRCFLGNNATVMASPEDMPEDFLKISAYRPKGAGPLEPILKPRWQDRFQVAIAGDCWLDFTVADKGTGMQALCSALGIAPDDCMAFGDNYNDASMLDFAGTSYLMASAAEPLRAHYPRQCRRVEDVLEELLR